MSDPPSPHSPVRAPQPIQRRTVLTTSAWLAPAVVVATAAPAYAGSRPTPPLVTTAVSTAFSTAVINGVERNYLDVTALFTNEGGDPTTAMTATANVEAVVGALRTIVVYDTDPGWTWNSSERTDTDGVQAVFTRRAPQLGGSPDTTTLFFRVWMTAPGSSGVVGIRPTPTPGVGVPGQTEWPQVVPAG